MSPHTVPHDGAAMSPSSAPVPSAAVLLQHHAGQLTPPVPQTLLAPEPSTPSLSDALYTGPSPSFLLPPTSYDHSPSHHRSIIATIRHPTSGNRAMRTNTLTTLDLQALPPSVTDPNGAIRGGSLRGPSIGYTYKFRRAKYRRVEWDNWNEGGHIRVPTPNSRASIVSANTMMLFHDGGTRSPQEENWRFCVLAYNYTCLYTASGSSGGNITVVNIENKTPLSTDRAAVHEPLVAVAVSAWTRPSEEDLEKKERLLVELREELVERL
ncbi:hypothetical protein V8E53_001842 [Lactarius tabidus]